MTKLELFNDLINSVTFRWLADLIILACVPLKTNCFYFLFRFLSSAAIVLSGKVTLDAFHFSSGVLLNGSISTSTELQGNVTYNEEKGLKSHINVTEKPQEILNIT